MGVELISEIVQKNNGQFPLVDSNNIRGGIYSVNSISERDNIPLVRRKIGMLCYVRDTDEYYRLVSENTWDKAKFGSDTIPIFDQELLDELGEDLPEKYITIPNKYQDLNGQTFSREISRSGTYVDILFSAIRKLQSEVARLKNSFQYGIYSYTDQNTAMSRIVRGIEDPDDEPLWAIEEEDLSLVNELVIGAGHTLTPSENVNIGTEGILEITGDVKWEDESLNEVTDPKLFCYITATKPTISIKFSKEDEQSKVLNLESLKLPVINAYNIMVVINRQDGENYIYVSIGNATRSQILTEGYLTSDFSNLIKTKNILNDKYTIKEVVFSDLHLSKLNFYSKYQDFSKQVIPSTPSDETYKYKVAHITIRSVKTESILQEIKNQLPNNELIFVEKTKKLWIKNNDQLIAIGSSSGGTEPEGMTESEVINLLKNMGIVREDGDNLHITDLSDITFIHQDTGNRFKFSVDSEGNLRSQKLPKVGETLEERVTNSAATIKQNVRGFIGQLRLAEYNKNSDIKIEIKSDARLYSDRVKIGAFYAPYDTDTVYGCNRAFVELENTADCDFNLEGCYLHYTCPNDKGEQAVYHLPLHGTIPAGGTYLIVGKKYVDIDDASAYIKISNFDQEWFIDGNLIDFTIDTSVTNRGYGFALTYGNENLRADYSLFINSNGSNIGQIDPSLSDKDVKNFPYLYDSSFIDAIYFKQMVIAEGTKGYWAQTSVNIKSNTMYRNMFELDPAKQAFQACNKADCSRNRWSSANDIWVMDLSNPLISFPHTSEVYPISKFAPKASFEHRNVQTDKSKLDTEKPNMVNCSFGTNIYTDRCFNWISVGVHDEYIWVRRKGLEEWQYAFESYRVVESAIEKPTSYPSRKEYSKELNNACYARIINRFPADNTQYTSHKCVVRLYSQSPSSKEEWEYIVGRRDKNGGPDKDHVSEIFTFTLYPESYVPRIYQTSDQQGFHWIEYQVWAAAANKLYEKIKQDQSSNSIIPIIINTGDMTQNGTRISEWYDYYKGGKSLFKEYEHNAVVGNNDLCNTDVNALGTGDDNGKSNSFYFHVCYCYDIDESTFVPVVNGKYIPSLYYFESKDYRFVNVNSEITVTNCKQWFNLVDGQDTINIYTGFTVGTNKRYINTFTSIYTMLYKMLTTTKKCIVSCHEMPFTVITNSSLKSGEETKSRSVSGSSLVGSHMNQISNQDVGNGTYWFSRLLEFKKVKLVLGGHKHTYACTYPLREYFYFDNKNSKDNYNEYSMEETLEHDNVIWEYGEGTNTKHLTKFPLTKRADVGQGSGMFYPYTPVPDLEGGVVYFMCQATGYKLTSNKELPSANQKFSMAIPQTNSDGSTDSANNNQKYPMFGVVKLGSNYQVQLVRIANIFNNSFKFAQNTYSTQPMKLQYFKPVSENNFGEWSDSEQILITI